jgi:alpha,alpha-trehalase
MFFDYNVVTRRQTDFESATTFYPLWAGLASRSQALRLVMHALPLFTMPGGIAGSSERSRGPITPMRTQTQWDFPFGWAPHQMLIWSGLERYGYDSLARDLAYRWLYTISLNACNYGGTIVEKYDVSSRSAQVFAEYGNVGTKFSYVTREGFGWTNASFVVGRTLLTPGQLKDLDRLVAPEWHRLREAE